MEKYIPYSISRFDGGQSENEFLSAGNDFSASSDINIYESPKYIELSKAFVAVTGFAPTGYITKILRLPNNIQSNARFSSVGEIFIDSGSGPALVHTLADSDKYIINAICFTSFLLVFTATDIHKITFTGNDFKTFASCTEAILSYTGDYTGFSTNESKDLPIYNFKDTLLYFGAGNKLFSVGNTLSAVSTSDTFRKGTKIIGFSFLNSNLKIFINYLNVGSELKYRTETQSDGMEYDDKVFKAVISTGQLDYVVCNDGLWLFNGVNGTKLFDYDFTDFGHTGSLYMIPQNLIAMNPRFVYIAYNKLIIKFGKKFTNLSYGFSISSTEANNITSLNGKLTLAGTLYYASDDKKGYYQGTTYKTSGYLEGIQFFGETMEKIKKVDRVFNAFETPTNTSIDVYFSVDGGAYPVDPKFTIAASSQKRKELFANELQNLTYHWIKVKLVLKGNGTVTPKLYEFTMFSEYIKNI